MADYLSPGVYVEEYDNSPKMSSLTDFKKSVLAKDVGIIAQPDDNANTY